MDTSKNKASAPSTVPTYVPTEGCVGGGEEGGISFLSQKSNGSVTQQILDHIQMENLKKNFFCSWLKKQTNAYLSSVFQFFCQSKYRK